MIPDKITQQYNLHKLANDGWVYIEVRKCMPGLKQASKVANDRPTKHLSAYGYEPVPRIPALWKHTTCPTTFTLCVDDFGVKYCSRVDTDHLLDALCDLYIISVDWKGSLYIRLNLKWDSIQRIVQVSMPKYIAAVLL